MKKNLLFLGLAMLGMSAQAKDYKYETVEGDLMKSRNSALLLIFSIFLFILG